MLFITDVFNFRILFILKINIFSQVVRYHSLVIVPETLPKELVPIAWTSCAKPLPFSENQNVDIFHDGPHLEVQNMKCTHLIPPEDPLSEAKNGKPSHLGQFEAASSSKILMGIRHSAWPHFGVQVCHIGYKMKMFCFVFTFLLHC